MMQAPKPPIPDSFWNTMFKITITSVSAVCLYSFWRQHRDSRLRFEPQWESLRQQRGSVPLSQVAESIRKISAGILEERSNKKGASILAVHDHARELLQHLVLERENDESSVVATLALQLVMLAFTKERETRTILARAGGYTKIVSLMSAAHSLGDIRVLDLACEALKEATSVEENELILPTDVPEGCEGSKHLAQQKLFPKILRTLDPQARPRFLKAMTASMANIALLQTGAAVISKGIDNKKGLDIFMRLIPHNETNVLRDAVRGVGSLVLHGQDDAHQCLQKTNLQKLVGVLDPHRDAAVLNGVLRILNMLFEGSFRDSFLMSVRETEEVMPKLFDLWVSDCDQIIRLRARILATKMGRNKITTAAYEQTHNLYAKKVEIRRQKDEQEEQQEKQMQQRAMAERQSMMQNMPPQLAAMMAAQQEGMEEDD